MAIKPIEILINAKDNASGVFDSLKAKVGAVGVAIAGYFGIQAFAGVVKGAADLEQGMSRVQAATGASAEEMAKLRKAAEDAGANTKYTSTEAALALENLAKAGLNATDAIAALPAVLNLAQAGDIELGTASEFVTKAVMGMGLAFSDAGRVADVLALGANATNTSVTGLAQALSYAAPVANSLGLSLESTVAIIGKFADAGIDASRAGTALNSILSQFGDPASKFRQELGAAGIVTNNFETALHQLAASGPGGAKAINAVGQEAGPALRALLNQGMGSLDALKVKLDGAAGSAAATAKVMQDNLNGSISGLSSAWDTLKNALGTPVLPVLKDGVDQLAAALKSAVSDGTITRFGESIAVAFQSGIKWVKEFVGTIDFGKVAADLRAFADRTGEVFTQIGEYASNASNSVKLAYGVMSAGTNTVMAGIYALGSGFATVASGVQSGLAALYEASSKVTFGALSQQYKAIADEIRLSSDATAAAAQALSDKSRAAFLAVTEGAQLARDGFSGMTGAMGAAKPAAEASSQAMAGIAQQLQAVAEKNAVARKATEDKKAADEAATVAVANLRGEYAALIDSGNLQAAAVKLQEINKALQGTPGASKDATKAAQEAAQAIADAFQRMGVTSSAELKLQASGALRDYNIIKTAGTSTAEDISAAFRVYAEKAIAANKGVASESLISEAAMRGLSIQVDGTGKAIVSAMGAGSKAMSDFGGHTRLTTEDLKAQAAAMDAINSRYANPKGRSVTGSSREERLAGQAATDGTGAFALREKQRTGTLSADDLKVAEAVLNAAKFNKQMFDENSKAYGLAGTKSIFEELNSATTILNQVKALADQKTTAGPDQGSGVAKASDSGGQAPAVSGGTTTVNINLNGSTQSINTDAAGAATLQSILGQLAAAQSTSIR